MLKRIAEKILLTPVIKPWLDKICRCYYYHDIKDGSAYYETMQASLDYKLDIGAEINEGDAAALVDLLRLCKAERILAAEIGSWKGLSTSVMARYLDEHNGALFAIDHWRGNEGTGLGDNIRGVDPFVVFLRNMRGQGLNGTVFPVVATSQFAATLFPINAFDFIFIDADHRYEEFKADVLLWLPKLKAGGIICGHDCEGYYSFFGAERRKVIDKYLSREYLPELKIHPGIIRALYELFGDNYGIMPGSSIWYREGGKDE